MLVLACVRCPVARARAHPLSILFAILANRATHTLAGTVVELSRRHFGPERLIRGRLLTRNGRKRPGFSAALFLFLCPGWNVSTYRLPPLFDLMRGPDGSFHGAVSVLQFWHEKDACCRPAPVGVCRPGFCRQPPPPSPSPSPPRARLKRTPVPGFDHKGTGKHFLFDLAQPANRGWYL
jgi:hypothetical protein